ncbi:MAG TPA: hypothetical protein VFS00_10535 [Polyangiaceae bacterium]|nr:hypothetical protein [Polyangiaceae bacterium]
MRALALRHALAATGALLAGAGPGRAEWLDPTLERLTLPARDAAGAESPCAPGGALARSAATGEALRCAPDQVGFRRLVGQYAWALAPAAPREARTGGPARFFLGAEWATSSIAGGRDHWRRGVERAPGAAHVVSLNLRKGLPAGFELGASLGRVVGAAPWLAGAEARWAPLEGARFGPLGRLPDVSFGAAARTLAGASPLRLTVVAAEARLSKRWPLGAGGVVAPFVGAQQVWLFGSAAPVDATPRTDAAALCGRAAPPPGPDGAPLCAPGGDGADFANELLFDDVRLSRQRLLAGVTYRLDPLSAGVGLAVEPLAPASGGGPDNEALAGEARQVAGALEVGVLF